MIPMLSQLSREKKSKYRSTKVVTAHGVFDSKKEYDRYLELATMQNLGAISDLDRQVKYELIPKFECRGEKFRACVYIADFKYIQNGHLIVEDVKGYKKGAAYQMFLLKRKMMAAKYGIIIKET